MTTYYIVKTINGRQGEVINSFNNVEEARECLHDLLRNCVNDDEFYFAGKAEAEAEIEATNDTETRESWGDDMCDRYIAALNDGIESGAPFIADRGGNVITCECDKFYYDNVTVEIVEG